MFNASADMRISYRIEGHDVRPDVMVRWEIDAWHAYVHIVDDVPSVFVTRKYDTSDEAIVGAEQHLARHFHGATIQRVAP